MHIVFVTTEFVTDKWFYGGLANFTANMATIFAEHNHKVTILVEDLNSGVRSFEWKKNIRIEYLGLTRNSIDYYLNKCLDEKPGNKIINNILYTYRSYCINRKIYKINKENKIDIVHYCSLMGVGLLRNNNIPSVIRMSSFPGITRHVNKSKFIVEDSIRDLNNIEQFELNVIKKSKAVISPSIITAKIMKDFFNKKITIIESPFYIEDTEWDYSEYNNDLLNKKYLLFYGTLSRVKGVHIINEIIYNIFDKYKDIYFVFVGKDSGIQPDSNRKISAITQLRDSAKEYRDRIIYFKALSKNKLFPIIENAYACVLPSILDNLPNTCIESMGLGKLVIGTKDSSFEQLIKDNVNGILCDNGSSNSLLEAIDMVMSFDSDQIEKMGYQAKHSINKLNPEKVYEKYLKYYQYVINCNNKNLTS